MTPPLPLAALIFDVDGTLADTEEAHRVAFNLAFQRFHLGWTWERAAYRELLTVTGGKERIANYIRTLPISPAQRNRLLAMVPELHAEKTRFYTSVVRDGGVALRDGIARLLDEAIDAGCRLAIASTTTRGNVDALLQSAFGAQGPGLFEVIACGDEVVHKKPAPDVYELALRRLGLPAARAVAFEDSPHGLRAALAAGLWTVVTPCFWTEGADFDGAGLLLPRLGDPWYPLDGEPGNALRATAWLSFAELAARAGDAAAPHTHRMDDDPRRLPCRPKAD